MFSLEVGELLKQSKLELSVVGDSEGLSRKINIPRIQKPGLALIGDTSKINPGRVQILGKSEITYLASLPSDKMEEILEKICKTGVACFIITRNNTSPQPLLEKAKAHTIPVLKTPIVTSLFINKITHFFDEALSDTTSVHGVFVDIFGVGTLIIGKSGIGKSECALDLLLRGHRLVADDVVEITKKPPATLFGKAAEMLEHHIEIRGLGILNVRELFGIASIRNKKIIDTVIELVEWNPEYDYDRLGIDEKKYNILDVPVPYLKIPVSPGRNITTIIEVAARNRLLKDSGHHTSQIFEAKLNNKLRDEADTDKNSLE